jgi:hypothetical protein
MPCFQFGAYLLPRIRYRHTLPFQRECPRVDLGYQVALGPDE